MKKNVYFWLMVIFVVFFSCENKSEEELSASAVVFDEAAYTLPAGVAATITGTVTAHAGISKVKFSVVNGSSEIALVMVSPDNTSYAFAQTFTPTAVTTGFKVMAITRSGVETTSTVPIAVTSSGGTVSPAPPAEQADAFPGAEGFGKYVTGGRGGTVYYVTNLNDAGAGSLRDAVNGSNRIVLFKVSGIIALNSMLEIKGSNLTIAGQTAPGDGICVKNYPVVVKANNIIIRYLRFRMGDEENTADDALWGRNLRNIIIDHCSMSWSTDECSSFYDNENFTMQWCIISESLRESVHGKGAHGYGGIWGGRRASFHHNLLAHHDSRNPRFCGSRYSNQPDKELVDFRNNVIYNWGSNSGYAGEGGSYNMVANYYKPGAGTSNAARIFQPNADNGENSQPAGVWGTFYVQGNYMCNKDGSPNAAVNADNWVGMTPNPSSKSKAELRADTEFEKGEVTTHSAEEAFTLVLNKAGASFRRDATDARVVNEVRNGLTPARASGGGSTKAGLIDTQADVGGWDAYNTAAVPVDTDGDGMPDEWEDAHNLNKNNPSDGAACTLSQIYTNVEVYINELRVKS
jgi:pectate lyase